MVCKGACAGRIVPILRTLSKEFVLERQKFRRPLKIAALLKETSDGRDGERRSRRRRADGRGNQNNFLAPTEDFQTASEVSESSSSFLGDGTPINSVNELSGNRAVVPFLYDVIAESLLVEGPDKQRFFQHIGGELFIGF